MDTARRDVGRAQPRLEGPQKVTGTARYAVEYPVDDVAHAWPVPATIVRGGIARPELRLDRARPALDGAGLRRCAELIPHATRFP